jgi:hypothetical protein
VTPIDITPTSSASQIVFQTVYPSSGNGTNIAGTGWGHLQLPSDDGVSQPDRVQFTPAPGSPTDPNYPATNVAHFELQPYYINGLPDGDVFGASSSNPTNRVEVYDRYPSSNASSTPAADWPDPVGSTRWYSYSIYIPAGFQTQTMSSEWFDFTQWKGLNSGSPAIAMEIRNSSFYLGGANASDNLGSISPGQWTHFVIGVGFSDSASSGWVTIYDNGSLVLNDAPTQTMNDATVNGVTGVDPSYLKMGIYRSKTWPVTQDIYLTPMVEGTTLSSVS